MRKWIAGCLCLYLRLWLWDVRIEAAWSLWYNRYIVYFDEAHIIPSQTFYLGCIVFI